MKQSFVGKRTLSAALALALCGTVSPSVLAIEFSSGEISGSFDTTISYGAAWRASDLDEDNIGKAAINPTTFLLDNAGQRAAPGRWSVNNDDGNLNYPDGGDLISHTIKFTSELDLRWAIILVLSPVSRAFTILRMKARISCRMQQTNASDRISGCSICTSGAATKSATAT